MGKWFKRKLRWLLFGNGSGATILHFEESQESLQVLWKEFLLITYLEQVSEEYILLPGKGRETKGLMHCYVCYMKHWVVAVEVIAIDNRSNNKVGITLLCVVCICESNPMKICSG
jgi:hypothetical protein